MSVEADSGRDEREEALELYAKLIPFSDWLELENWTPDEIASARLIVDQVLTLAGIVAGDGKGWRVAPVGSC